MNINFYGKSMRSFIILSVMWYERLTRWYILHIDPSEFKELGKTCQATCFPFFELLELYWTYFLALQITTPKICSMRLMSLDHEPRMRCCAMSLNYGLWWDNIAMSFGPSASASFCEYGLFWALKEIFPKFIICWCGANCQWNKFHVVWKFFLNII